jgi:hypothetical protein
MLRFVILVSDADFAAGRLGNKQIIINNKRRIIAYNASATGGKDYPEAFQYH